MIWNIICNIGEENEQLDNKEILDDQIEFSLGRSDGSFRIESNAKNQLRKIGIQLNGTVLDLFHLGHFVYAIDRSISRKSAYNHWERGFNVTLPVSEPNLWVSQKENVQEILNFLTGDHWNLSFKQLRVSVLGESQQPPLPIFPKPDVVALLSGGLDSFVGAIELLEKHVPVTFISHYARGGVLKSLQAKIYDFLNEHYQKGFNYIQFFVHPPKSVTRYPEPTSRSRSILYLSLAIAVASASEQNTDVNISENGLISLNVPMTKNRVGSLSTRTTHPYLLEIFQELINQLGINVNIQNPYQYLTKGEMVERVSNLDVARDGIALTISCSQEASRRFKGISPYTHCGYCLPCLVRKAAIKRAGLDDLSNYHIDIPRELPAPDSAEGQDLRALEMALIRLKSSTPIFEVKKAGQLPGSPDDLVKFADLYNRGMYELEDILK